MAIFPFLYSKPLNGSGILRLKEMSEEREAREICRSLLFDIAFLNLNVHILLLFSYNEGANENVSLILFILFLLFSFLSLLA